MNLSLKQYRNIDLGIMLFILAAAEAVIAHAARSWFADEMYVLSPTIAMVCIVMMRWGGYAAVHALGGGLALCIASGADAGQFAVYCAGNCFALAAMGLFKLFGKERIRNKAHMTVLFTIAAFFAAQVGRWLVGLLMGGSVTDLITLIASDSLSLLFAVITVQIARKIDGLFED